MRKKKISVTRLFRGIIARFWLMGAYILIICIIFWNTYYNFKTQPQYFYLRKILGGWLCVSRGAAPVITFCSLGALFATCRSLHTVVHKPLSKLSSSFLAYILSRMTHAHTVFAKTLIIFSVIHSGAHVMNAINFSTNYFYLYPEINVAKYKGENPAYLICTWTGCSGIAMLFILLLMAYTSTSKYRKKDFNQFYIIHHFFLIYLLLLLAHPLRGVLKEQYNINEHVPGCMVTKNGTTEKILIEKYEVCKGPPQFQCISTKNWLWIVLALATYFIEMISRKYYSKKFVATQFCTLPGKAVHVKIKVNKKFNVKPGQYILLQCDKISSIEWHPFTVTQCPSENQKNFDILISVRGDWTKKLYNLALNPYSFTDDTNYILKTYITPFVFNINGPFASPMQSIKKDKIAICIAAGVGITAYIAILKNLIDEHLKTKIYLLWLTRDPEQLMWYSKLLSHILTQLWLRNKPDQLLIKFHITKDYDKLQLEYLFDNELILSRIFRGRPNWKNEFKLWSKLYKKFNLYCCGPNNLRKVLNKHCCKMRKQGIACNFIYEGF